MCHCLEYKSGGGGLDSALTPKIVEKAFIARIRPGLSDTRFRPASLINKNLLSDSLWYPFIIFNLCIIILMHPMHIFLDFFAYFPWNFCVNYLIEDILHLLSYNCEWSNSVIFFFFFYYS